MSKTTFVAVFKENAPRVNDLRVIAITHKHFSLEEIGRFHIQPEQREEVLQNLKSSFQLSEVMFLSTCNRVELVFSLPHYVCPGLTAQLLSGLHPNLDESFIKSAAARAERYNGAESIQHLLRVASSLESLVIGEREIITQLRKSYEDCEAIGLTGDSLRIAIHQCVKTAKEIFTYTDLSKKPVSVVSLAWQRFKEFGIKTDAPILLIGAGQIIRNFSKFLFENGYNNITVANRNIERAAQLTQDFSGKAILLSELKNYTSGFDALVSCTASEDAVVNTELYRSLISNDNSKKLVIDLALPTDIAPEVVSNFDMEYVDMVQIQQMASTNIQYREQAIVDCEPIIQAGMKECERAFNERKIENAMRSIPDAIKEIKSTALGNVFAKDLEQLDDNSKEVLEKILQYMEKKYISVPMKMAREVLLDAVQKN